MGEPAFPETRYAGNTNRHPVDTTPGMTLRDWFAGQALVGLNGLNPNLPNNPAGEQWPGPAELARRQAAWAYIAADALLAERSK